VSHMKKILIVGLGLLGGCSAAVGDLQRVPVNPESCEQTGNPEIIRDAHFEFDEMQPHSTQQTVLTLLGGPPGSRSIRAKALIRDGFNAAQGGYDPARCRHIGPVRDDGSVRLLMSFNIPTFIPPDGRGSDPTGGPYVVEFWSDANDDGMLGAVPDVATEPGDHLWVRPMCTNGNMYFVHASGLDDPETLSPRQRAGNFRFTIAPLVATAIERASGAVRILDSPMVVEANWQGQTVAYIRTVLACEPEPTPMQPWSWELRRVIDTGSVHTVRVYWDVNRDGEYTTECDPICTLSQMSTATGLEVELTMDQVTGSCAAPTGRCASNP
jgi:hypothetical protein